MKRNLKVGNVPAETTRSGRGSKDQQHESKKGEVVSAWSKECERSVMNKIVEDAKRGYEINI